MRTVEGKTVVDHEGHESQLQRVGGLGRRPFPQAGAEEDRLARVRIADPSVEYQATAEVGEIIDLLKQNIRQKIVNGQLGRIARELRSKVAARGRRDGLRTQFEGGPRVFAQELGRDLDQRIRTGNLQIA